FESNQILLFAFTGILAFWIFIAHCATAEQPFLSPSLLKDRNFTVGIIIAFAMGMLSFTSLVLFPSLLHDLKGYPDTVIGSLIASRGLGNWTAFFFIARLTKVAPRLAISSGLAIQGAAAYWMAHFDINVDEASVFWSHYLVGLGQSVTFTPMTVMAFTTLPKHQITEGSAVFTLMRNFGSSLFISMSVLVLVRYTSINYSEMMEFISPYRRSLSVGLPPAWDPETAAGLGRIAREVQRQAAMIGYVNAFYLMAATGFLAVPLAWLLRSRAPAS
ncbi:MAG: MFS transporter, partial [Hyphomicrobiaceae bacterium]